LHSIYAKFRDEPYSEYTKSLQNDAQFRTAEMGKYSMSAMGHLRLLSSLKTKLAV
jgi:hypothetical protein